MTELHAPLKQQLPAEPSELAVARMWRAIEQRSLAAPRRGRARMLARVATLTVAGALMLAWVGISRFGAEAPAAILTLEGGAAWPATLDAHEPRRVALSDGSWLQLAKGAALESLRNGEQAVLLKQLKGKVAYAIQPGGPRTWTIECGAVSVEVVGTRFEVERSDARVRVAVTEGVVLVRGEGVPDRVARLTVGDTLDVPVQPASASAPAPPQAPAQRAHEPEKAPQTAAPRPPAQPWRKLAAQGEHGAAYRALGERGIASLSASASVDDLFALADVARLSGHAEDAVAPLARIVQSHRADARASLAAFTLGRIQLRTLGKPVEATRTLRQALALSVPTDLQEDTYALLVEALVASGQPAEARAAYTRCRSAGRECRGAGMFLSEEQAR